MLGGIAPVIIFNLFKKTPDVESTLSKIPLVSDFANFTTLPPIPLYLDEGLTGIFISNESKNVDIDTSTETNTKGTDPDTNQKGLGNIVTIDMFANNGSVGLTLLSAFIDSIYPLVTSKEYSITYIHGAITVFNGLLHQFSIQQSDQDDLYRVQLQLVRNTSSTIVKSAITQVNPGALKL